MNDTYLIPSFNRMREAIHRFLTQLAGENRQAWIFDLEKREYSDQPARERLMAILERLEYPDDRDGRETDPCPGIVGVSPKTMQLAAAMNRSRDEFREAVLAVNRKDRESARRIMARRGYPRLHFKQVYRHVPILLKKPDSVRFTWGATRSIKKISQREAYQWLVKLAGENPSPGYQRQLDLLAELPRDEPIAIVQDLKPHIKANVCWNLGRAKNREVRRKMISAALAILIPLDPGETLPAHSAAYPDERRTRKTRADIKIEKEVFLPSIRGHRYASI